MHEIFDSHNSVVNRFSNFAVNIVSYDLVLTGTVKNSLKVIMMTIGLLFQGLIFHYTVSPYVGINTNDDIV